MTGLNDKKSQAEDLTKLMKIWRRCTSAQRDFEALGDMNICARRMEDKDYANSDIADILQDFLLSKN